MNKPDWYTIQNIDEIDSPALVVYPDRIQKNIERMKEIVGDVQRLRPHIKTHKMAEVVRMQMENGIHKFKCATIAEAEMLGNEGVANVLLAYQPVGPKVHRLLELVEKFPNTQFAALVDNKKSAQHIDSIFSNKNKTLQLWLDLDVGQHRTGVFADQRALNLFLFCKNLPANKEGIKGIEPVGFHVYDGHLRDSDFEIRKKESNQCFQLVEKLVVDLANLGIDRPKIVAGGSPTFTVHALRENIDCSPGTCLLWDFGYNHLLPEQKFNYAALVISRIISKPASHLLCLDLGHKSIAAENPFPRVHFLNLPDTKQISQSEEHLILDVGDNSKFEIGMTFYGVPKHICPTCALYEKVFVVENGRAEKEWRVVARDRKITV